MEHSASIRLQSDSLNIFFTMAPTEAAPNIKEEYIETLERIQRKTLIPHLVARENSNGGWSADAHSYGICETENSGEDHMGNWVGKFLHGLIKHGHTKETAVKSLEYAKNEH
jgi:hypothetical protein